MPKVSVLIPAYNCEKYIKETLDCLLKQTYKDFETIVVDDGSTDNTKKEICDWIKNNGHIQCEYVYKENGGSASARNFGLGYCNGDLIQLLDSDDILLPEKIKVGVEEMEKSEKIGCVYTDYFQFGNNIDDTQVVSRADFSIERLMQECIPTTNCMIRKHYLKKVGGWDECYKFIEDYGLWTKMCLICDFIHIKEPLFKYRIHKDNKTNSDVTKSELWLKEHCWVKSNLRRKISGIGEPKIACCMAGGIGDLVAISSTYKKFKEFYPYSEIVHFCYDSPFYDILEHNPYIDEVIAGGNLIDMLQKAPQMFPDHKVVNADYYYRYGNDYWKTPLHLAQFFCQDIMGVHFDLNSHNPEFYYNPDGSDFIKPDKLIKKLGEDFIVVESQTRSNKQGKEWNGFDEVYSHLDKIGVPVVSIASSDIPKIEGYKNVISVRDFKIRESARLIEKCSFILSLQSGCSWIAQSFRKKGVMINIGSPASYCGRWGENVEIVDQKEPFSPQTVSVEEVLQKIDFMLKKNNY